MVTEMNDFLKEKKKRKKKKAATFSTPCENIEMKCTWTLASMIWSMDFITSACQRPCPK
jgi:hypothetical protein